jgi:transposase
MNPFLGPNSILVMDNAAIHHGGRIAEICDDADVLLFYLPPYSPDLNPIEKVFSVLKSQLKRHEILTGTAEDAEIIKDFLPSFVTPDLMRALFRGCGYSA